MVLSPTAAFGALVLGATSISLGVIAVKQGYAGGSDPQSLNAARLLVAAPCVALALPFLLRAGRPIGVRGALFAIAAGGLIWFASRAELEGLARLPAGMLALLLATAPVWVAAFDWIGLGGSPAESSASRFRRSWRGSRSWLRRSDPTSTSWACSAGSPVR